MSDKLLQVEGLTTSFKIDGEYYPAVEDVTFDIGHNEVLALVGESGSGKSVTAFSLMKLHKKARVEGSVKFEGKNILDAKESEMNKIRGGEFSMIFQDPMTALNPLMRIKHQIIETLDIHETKKKSEREAYAIELLDRVGIPNAQRVGDAYPHELSGGMRQRVVIAIAIANSPKLLIADEPTTALDVTIQAQILDLIRDLKNDLGSGVLMITHDLGVVAEMADRVAVMYAGQIVELATVTELFKNPLHPYTRSLLNSLPSEDMLGGKLHVIQGVVPALNKMDRTGCRFAPRIPWISADEHEHNPQLREVTPGHFVRCTCYKNFFLDSSDKITKLVEEEQFEMIDEGGNN
ncbi:ABC transporter ATP-binding protein [Phocicoccus pinnipedialis]|uniref:Oligopeptide transport ATP-binding protein OppD n=1 Tax=Phocicoccus pinnipedialis TaxID=110845 RepID=A0A6V7R709_9BACL|nr:ABC transporter ATP-binding protein [Jeotgalicoccus pinnipedialis]MBP1938913.1 peptide/nickel transport system ATP-binding protein [Jeotgalicoccus pinnipedialis]CAD2073247.1 Oligopeptide transport ATP-binding protein OppD [Jeotgalicoccus pinnipedialis]